MSPNKRIFDLLVIDDEPESPQAAANTVSEFTRSKMREEGFFWRIMNESDEPPVRVVDCEP